MAGHGCHEKELLKAVWGQFGGGLVCQKKIQLMKNTKKKLVSVSVLDMFDCRRLIHLLKLDCFH